MLTLLVGVVLCMGNSTVDEELSDTDNVMMRPVDIKVYKTPRGLNPETLAQCSGTPSQGGVYIDCKVTGRISLSSNAAQLVCILCRWLSYTTTGSGGCVYVSSSSHAQLVDCTFYNISLSGYSGGALFVSSSGAGLNATNCTFTMCRADNNGGAIYVNQGDTEVLDSIFTECATQKYSGGVIGKDSSVAKYWANVTVVNCMVINCSSGYDGAFICASNGNTYIESCQCINLTSHLSGGAFFVCDNAQMLNVWNTTFTGCMAEDARGTYGGGVLRVSTACINFTDVVIENCRSLGDGGAIIIANEKSCELVLERCDIVNCVSDMAGGAITWYSGSSTLSINCLKIQQCRSTSQTSGHAMHIVSIGDYTFNMLCVIDCGESPFTLPASITETIDTTTGCSCRSTPVLSTNIFTKESSMYGNNPVSLVAKVSRFFYLVNM